MAKRESHLERVAPTSGWDVGERPPVLMAYFEYPEYEAGAAACRRDETAVATVQMVRGSKEKQRRLAERTKSGWASGEHGRYRPLGTLKSLPTAGVEVRQQKEQEYLQGKPVLVTPDWQEAQKAELQQTSAAVHLDPGVAVVGSVTQFEYVYYQIELRERKNLRFELKAVSGDPDIFVSNEVSVPTIDDHAWRSGGAGDDSVLITTGHPRYAVGIFFIGIYSIHDSEFVLEATVEEEPIRFSAAHEQVQGNGFDTLTHLVHGADQRRRACMHGGEFRTSKSRPPADPSRLYRELPQHLQAALAPPKAASEPTSPLKPRADGGGGGAAPGGGGGAERPSTLADPSLGLAHPPRISPMA